MSELINNQEYRRKKIKELLQELQQGKPLAEVKTEFAKLVKDLAPRELAALEQQLINEGLSREDLSQLGDSQLLAFKKNLETTPDEELTPGHPIHTFMLENQALAELVAELKEIYGEFLQQPRQENLFRLQEKLNLLWDVEKHYSRKENILFPFLEKYEITGPSRIMWTQDDEVRDLLKEVKTVLLEYNPQLKKQLQEKLDLLGDKVLAMISKEENVVFRTALKILSEDEWYQILVDSSEIGYCLIEPSQEWRPAKLRAAEESLQGPAGEFKKGYLRFATGVLTPQEVELILNHLPMDVTYVDKAGLVKYFSAGQERIFVRSRSIIGRKVENCHPPASVDIVEKLVEDLASGKKDYEDFWLHLGDKYVWIRYIALRDSQANFVGVMECTQDIKPLQALTGEKRIAD